MRSIACALSIVVTSAQDLFLATPTPAPQPVAYPYISEPPLGFQPNIVFILTDDQDVELGGLEPMPQLRKLVGEQGLTHEKFYINTPVCCPSRSEFLSGRFHHNIRDRHYQGQPGCGDEAVGKEHPCDCMRVNSSTLEFEQQTYAGHLQQAGYTTAYFGKYLNPPAMEIVCGKRHAVSMPGWDEFFGMCNTAYFNVTWSDNGVLNTTGSKPEEYTTSLIGNRSVAFLEKHAREHSAKPFLLVAAPRAPHGPSIPAPWYTDALPNVINRKTPAYDYKAVGHIGWIADLPPLTEHEAKGYDKHFRNRWQTLLSVDDLVGALVEVLNKTNQLNRTYVFYTSDHGYHQGQMRLNNGKSHHYEFDARVPFLIRGPGVATNSTAHFLAGNVDFGPTVLDIAGWRGPGGIRKPPIMDGRSFFPQIVHVSAQHKVDFTAVASRRMLSLHHEAEAISSNDNWRTRWLLEFSGLSPWPRKSERINDCPNNTWRALRFVGKTPVAGLASQNMIYVEFTSVDDWFYDHINFHELYDIDADPYELVNLYNESYPSDEVKQVLAQQMLSDWTCRGEDCP